MVACGRLLIGRMLVQVQPREERGEERGAKEGKGKRGKKGRGGTKREQREKGKGKSHGGRPQDQNLNMEIAFDIGAGVMLAMGNNTCKSKGERVSKRSVPTKKRG